LELDPGPLKALRLEGNVLVGVHVSSGGSRITSVSVFPNISGSGIVPVTDPESTPTVRSIRVTATLGTGTITGISGAPPLGRSELPVRGFARVCLFGGGCASQNLPVNLTLNDGNTGVGVGGLLTLGARGTIRISIENAPWTLGTVTGINQTDGGGFKTLSRAGFVHGAASATSATVFPSGAALMQLIAPQQVETRGSMGTTSC
jgi:hypothetical protein